MLNNQSGDEGKGKTNYTTKQDVVEDKQVIPQDRTDAFLSVSECSQLPNKFGSKDCRAGAILYDCLKLLP